MIETIITIDIRCVQSIRNPPPGGLGLIDMIIPNYGSAPAPGRTRNDRYDHSSCTQISVHALSFGHI